MDGYFFTGNKFFGCANYQIVQIKINLGMIVLNT